MDQFCSLKIVLLYATKKIMGTVYAECKLWTVDTTCGHCIYNGNPLCTV